MPITAREIPADPTVVALAGSFRTGRDARDLTALLNEAPLGERLVLDLTDLDIHGRFSWRRLRRVVNRARATRPIAAHARTLERRMTIERRGLRGAFPVEPPRRQ